MNYNFFLASLLSVLICIIFPKPSRAEIHTVYSLGLSLDGNPGPLLRANDGSFYAVFASGGRLGRGSIFHLAADGSTKELIFDFADASTNQSSSASALVAVTNGMIYGVFTDFPSSGGTNQLYRVSTNGSGFTVIQGLPALYDSLLLASDGRFYLSVDSRLDRFELDGRGYTTVTTGFGLSKTFEGDDGFIYGLLSGASIGRLRKDGSELTTLTNTTRGILALVQGVDGRLYGAEDNFPNGEIALVLNRDGTALQQLGLVDTGGQDSSIGSFLDGENGKLYATLRLGPAQPSTQIIAIDKAGGVGTLLKLPAAYGNNSGGQFIALGADGNLFGTSSVGGTNGGGVLYRVGRDGLGLSELIQLGGQPGSFVQAALLFASDQRLYGTARQGGLADRGMVFRVDGDGRNFRVLKEFASIQEGLSPRGGLIEVPTGALFGTTQSGGTHNGGTLFKMNRDGSGFEILVHFDANTGTNPLAKLLFGTDGAIYGSCNQGGTTPTNGTLWKVQTNGANFTVLKRFSPDGKEGRRPFAPMIEGADGMLYGVTDSGGTAEKGVIFKLAKDGTGYQVLRNLLGFGDTANPEGQLLQLHDGTLVGVGAAGGANGLGAIFRIQTNGASYRVIHSFVSTNSDARTPIGGLVLAGDGSLLGTTRFGGGQAVGTIYSIRPDGAEYQILHRFSNAYPSPQEPWAALVPGIAGTFFGVTSLGGLGFNGTIFRLDLPGQNSPELHVRLFGNVMVFSWSDNSAGFQLQTAPNLAADSIWQPVAQPPALTNANFTVSLPVSGLSGFYRLKKI